MKTASAIVTYKGGRTCHAAIVSRELGIPAVVGTTDATEKIKTGQEITVSCVEGDNGVVYQGLLDFHVEKIDLSNLKRPKTKIMMNLGNPDQAFSFSMIPNDGVGLARMESIIKVTDIRYTPMALVLSLKSHIYAAVMEKIDHLTYGYERRRSIL